VSKHGQLCGLSHCQLCNAPCWSITNIDSGDGVLFNLSILRVSPEEAVEMHFLVLKPYRIVHFFYVPKCGEDPLPESDEDSTNVVKDVWTFEE
jgi:hypothetical protein